VAGFYHAVQKESKHAELMTQALKHALIKREVSHITFPDEVQFTPKPAEEEAQTPEGRITPFTISPPQQELEKAVNLISQSKRPVIIVGHGARYSMTQITQMAEKMNSPVITTFKGKGLIADSHPLGCGVLGRSGTPIASWFMNESDMLIVFGSSFSNHTGITPKKPIIHIDFDPMALSKFHKVEVALWGEIGVTCTLLEQTLKGKMKTIGFALPAAMGAWAAVKDTRPVWSLSGDGGLGQYLAEISTLVKYNMPIKHILINNSELGKISKEQRNSKLDVWQTSLHNPNFADYANNCGALGIRVERIEDLEPAMKKIRDHKGPALLDIICDVSLI